MEPEGPVINIGKGSVFIAPKLVPPGAVWENLGYLVEDDRPTFAEQLDLMKIQWRDPKPLTLTLRNEMLSDETLRLLTGIAAPRKKETRMIEKKNFVTPPVKTPAGSLAHRHLGSLVTITLPSGAEITDVLVGVRAGYVSDGQSEEDKKLVTLYLQNVGVGYDPRHLRDYNGEFKLDPKSVVLVRRPKAVKAPAKKGARR